MCDGGWEWWAGDPDVIVWRQVRTVDERADKVDNDQMSVITQYKLMCYYVGEKCGKAEGLGGQRKVDTVEH